MALRLNDEIAVVTGSTHGIGRATAIRFAAEGANVVVTGRDKAAGKEVVGEVVAAGGEGVFVRADMTESDVGERVIGTVLDAFGPPTILVNNAGSSDLVRNGIDRAISEITDEGWNRVLETNLTGAVRVTRAALAAMIPARRGSIVNISSRAASVGIPGIDGYTAVKGALESLTRSIAVEYAEYGIRCNAIRVAFVRVVDERAGRPSINADQDERYRHMLLTRGGQPNDVANAVLFLSSSEAQFVTGIVLPVDGGASAVSGLPWVSDRPAMGGSNFGKSTIYGSFRRVDTRPFRRIASRPRRWVSIIVDDVGGGPGFRCAVRRRVVHSRAPGPVHGQLAVPRLA
jgi:NAD(P)-dependent dehydrogenase (short-subunit alcohol dehydrogenase family)